MKYIVALWLVAACGDNARSVGGDAPPTEADGAIDANVAVCHPGLQVHRRACPTPTVASGDSVKVDNGHTNVVQALRLVDDGDQLLLESEAKIHATIYFDDEQERLTGTGLHQSDLWGSAILLDRGDAATDGSTIVKCGWVSYSTPRLICATVQACSDSEAPFTTPIANARDGASLAYGAGGFVLVAPVVSADQMYLKAQRLDASAQPIGGLVDLPVSATSCGTVSLDQHCSFRLVATTSGYALVTLDANATLRVDRLSPTLTAVGVPAHYGVAPSFAAVAASDDAVAMFGTIDSVPTLVIDHAGTSQTQVFPDALAEGPAVTGAADGTFAVSWRSNRAVFYAAIDATGTIAPPQQIASGEVSALAATSDGFMVAAGSGYDPITTSHLACP